MLKRLRDRVTNKKGFTLVELIVVVVIILVMSAILIPNVLKYTRQASEANTKQTAASILTEVQVQVADANISGETINNYVIGGASVSKIDSKSNLSIDDKGSADTPKAEFVVDEAATSNYYGQVTYFAYQDGKNYITWSNQMGWLLNSTVAENSDQVHAGGNTENN